MVQSCTIVKIKQTKFQLMSSSINYSALFNSKLDIPLADRGLDKSVMHRGYPLYFSPESFVLKFSCHSWHHFIAKSPVAVKEVIGNGILLPKLFWPTVRKNCSSDREKLLKFETEGWEFAKFLRSLEQFIQTVKGQNNF